MISSLQISASDCSNWEHYNLCSGVEMTKQKETPPQMLRIDMNFNDFFFFLASAQSFGVKYGKLIDLRQNSKRGKCYMSCLSVHIC